jgi:hypothetical protein
MSKYFEEMDRKNKNKGQIEGLRLAIALTEQGRVDELEKATKDDAYREKLLKEFDIQ